MTNREFDRWLRQSLSSVSPDSVPGDWEEFVKRVENAESNTDTEFDAAVRDGLAPLGNDHLPEWGRMESLLDADEAVFDSEIRDSINTYQAPYNPDSWPILDEKLDADDRDRRRLIVAKALEVTAIFVVALTFLNFFPTIQSLLKDQDQPVNLTSTGLETASIPDKQDAMVLPEYSSDSPAKDGSLANISGSPVLEIPSGSAINFSEDYHVTSRILTRNEYNEEPEIAGSSVQNSRATVPLMTLRQERHEGMVKLTEERPLSAYSTGLTPRFTNDATPINSAGLTSLQLPGRLLTASVIPVASYPNPSRVRFSMFVGADVNTLFIPEDHFYSQGRSFRFSEKSVVAGGYSAGASLLFDKQKFQVEVGLAYSQKSFSPGRKLFLGTSPDEHSLDFDNITLNIISLPVNLHVKIDGKGVWRVYGIAGAAINVVASANYDLITETSFASAAPQDPFQLQTEREIQRVKESMLDGAKFSSKGYLTANAGIGIEHFINGRTSIFAQPVYQYQIPFFKLIDQNGKHLQTGSLVLGTRISL